MPDHHGIEWPAAHHGERDVYGGKRIASQPRVSRVADDADDRCAVEEAIVGSAEVYGLPERILVGIVLLRERLVDDDGRSLLAISRREEAATAKWKELPPVYSVNVAPAASLKPGATLLLSGTDQRGRDQVVLAFQRYGRGKTLALPVQDTWLWRMHSKMPVEDMTHHNLWQRLARWLVDGVPERTMVSAAPDRVQKGEPVTLTSDVMDPEYRGVNEGRIAAHVTAPSGKVEDVVMEWTVEQDGEYRARFTPTEDGLYRIAVDGQDKAGAAVERGTMAMRVAPSDAEYFDAAMRTPLLRRIAEETEGRFFRAAETSSLVDAISYSGKGVTVTDERELWDMPIVLLCLMGLMAGEWLFRRTKGLA